MKIYYLLIIINLSLSLAEEYTIVSSFSYSGYVTVGSKYYVKIEKDEIGKEYVFQFGVDHGGYCSNDACKYYEFKLTQSSQNDPSVYGDWKKLETVRTTNFTYDSDKRYSYYYSTFKKANAKYLFFEPLRPPGGYNGDELHLYINFSKSTYVFYIILFIVIIAIVIGVICYRKKKGYSTCETSNTTSTSNTNLDIEKTDNTNVQENYEQPMVEVNTQQSYSHHYHPPPPPHHHPPPPPHHHYHPPPPPHHSPHYI